MVHQARLRHCAEVVCVLAVQHEAEVLVQHLQQQTQLEITVSTTHKTQCYVAQSYLQCQSWPLLVVWWRRGLLMMLCL